jgi:dTDP-4-dehydrorhamnose 3,5-epimerase
MIFRETTLLGAYVVDIDKLADSRGFFARTWCQREFDKAGLISRMVQASISFNMRKGTLRGLHFQRAPSMEAKLVRVTQGAIFDVIVDLRPDSDTFLKYYSITLDSKNRSALYIPPGFAHGFQTTEEHTEVFYQMSDFYNPEYACGVRWDDPVFGIEWPEGDRILLDRDRGYADFSVDLVAAFLGY